MSTATRQVLEKLGSMLKDARPLSPSDARPDRAQAPATQSKPSLAAAAKADEASRPAAPPPDPQTALSADTDDTAASRQ
jgi:hypothetical protein